MFLAERNRETLLRICPTTEPGRSGPAAQFTLEYRAADATANPWLALTVLVRAGLAGLTGDHDEPTVWPEDTDPARLSQAPSLPATLDEALEALEKDHVVRSWFDPRLLATHLSVKRSELAQLDGLDDAARIRKVRNVY
ncbi:hypothetical protein [Streptomyces lydicus]|uniref:hypothetical protein n=1 Tax=Streptomyces lydicus TaxID=47763 RepID=UPI0037911765